MMGVAACQSGFGFDFRKFFGIICLLGAVVCMVTIVYTLCNHAYLRHSMDAVVVNFCIESNGPIGKWQRASDGRIALPCQVDNNKWGIRIDEQDGSNVTAIIKEKMNKAFQIIRYLRNSGFTPMDEAAQAWEQANPIPEFLSFP